VRSAAWSPPAHPANEERVRRAAELRGDGQQREHGAARRRHRPCDELESAPVLAERVANIRRPHARSSSVDTA
jgi:hypothetical protein